MDYGEIAYVAYGNSVHWRNFLGDPMPGWDELPISIRQAWREAADDVLKKVT